MSKEEESKYLYPVDVLDKLIQEMDEGIEPMLNDQMIIEIEMRRKEISLMMKMIIMISSNRNIKKS